jgi:hypothetical protein
MMSRLLDRILTSCQRFKVSMLYDEAEQLDQFRQFAIEESDDEAAAQANAYKALKFEPTAIEAAPIAKLESVPVITADDVALYLYGLGEGLHMSDLVASMATSSLLNFREFLVRVGTGMHGVSTFPLSRIRKR